MEYLLFYHQIIKIFSTKKQDTHAFEEMFKFFRASPPMFKLVKGFDRSITYLKISSTTVFDQKLSRVKVEKSHFFFEITGKILNF